MADLLSEAASRTEPAPATVPTQDNDPGAKVRWNPEDPDLLFNTQPATRVYRNPYGQVVICQEAPESDGEDPYVFFEITNIPKLIAALQREIADGR